MAKQTDPERLGHHLELFQTTFHEIFLKQSVSQSTWHVTVCRHGSDTNHVAVACLIYSYLTVKHERNPLTLQQRLVRKSCTPCMLLSILIQSMFSKYFYLKLY